MLGGFEEPPVAGMRFEFHGPLADLGPQAFPTEGDQRFRPCGGPGFRVVEDRSVGHASVHRTTVIEAPPIAAISSRDGSRKMAPMIYVWFRMWDVVDREELLRRVLRIAADRLPSP